MKLLGWMNFKLKQKGNEPANTIIVAHKEVKSNGSEMNFQEEPYDEIFPGFLAIGTLGCQTTNTDPPTPTFPMPFEDVIIGETDITEKELKFINDELEKFLEEKVNEVAYESSERNSHASIISLGDKHMETGATECYSSNMEEFPLQKYLFGSSVELPEIEAEVKQRGFLEELFQEKNIVQECHHVGNDGKGKKQAKKNHAMQFMKKMLQNLQSKSKGSRASSKENANVSTSSKRKLAQVLKMFKRKVHPEELMNKNKLQDYESSNISFKSGNLRANSEENKKISPANASKVSPRALAVNKEHWINTDADYLVLEL